MKDLDEIDIKILEILQENGRTKRNQIAELVNLSVPSVSERLQKLENLGYIEGYYAKLNRKKFNYDILVFIVVEMEKSRYYEEFAQKVKNYPEILECYSILGAGSHMLKAVAKDTQHLEKLLSEIQSWKGVVKTITNFALSTIKETVKIKLK
jgi:Lrp/AsnC family leucine-responsive transcriptional regulator